MDPEPKNANPQEAPETPVQPITIRERLEAVILSLCCRSGVPHKLPVLGDQDLAFTSALQGLILLRIAEALEALVPKATVQPDPPYSHSLSCIWQCSICRTWNEFPENANCRSCGRTRWTERGYAAATQPEPPIPQRCTVCNGTGLKPVPDTAGAYCRYCKTGRDLERMNRVVPGENL